MKANGNTDIITKDVLKRKTLEFDIGCIYNLNLSLLGIFDLGCIGECTELVVLDLSSNKISNVKPLATLKQLQILKLQSNRIADLNGLDELVSLYSLDVAGNFLNSVHALFPLRNLEKFENLRLSNLAKNLANPVCESNSNYRQEILQLLPRLKLLEGELVTGRGSEFVQFCSQLDVALKERQHDISNRAVISLEKSPSYPIAQIPAGDAANIADVISDEESKILELLKECERANNKAKAVVNNAEKSMT